MPSPVRSTQPIRSFKKQTLRGSSKKRRSCSFWWGWNLFLADFPWCWLNLSSEDRGPGTFLQGKVFFGVFALLQKTRTTHWRPSVGTLLTSSVRLMTFCGHDSHFPDEETESQKRGGSLTFIHPAFLSTYCMPGAVLSTLRSETDLMEDLDVNEIVM